MQILKNISSLFLNSTSKAILFVNTLSLIKNRFRIQTISLPPFLIFLFCLNSFAQDVNEAKDILRRVSETDRIKDKIELFDELSIYYRRKDLDSALSIGRKMIALSEKEDYSIGVSKGQAALALAEAYKLNFTEAQEAANKVIKLNNHDLSLYKAYYVHGFTNVYSEDFIKAIWGYRNALDMAQRMEDKPRIIMCFGNISFVHFNLGNYDRAISNSIKALDLAEEIEDSYGMAMGSVQLSYSYRNKKEYKKARELNLHAIKISKLSEYDLVTAYAYNELSKIAIEEKKYDQALGYNEKAIEYANRNAIDEILLTDIDYTNAKAYFYLGLLEKALKSANNAYRMAHRVQDKKELTQISKLQLQIYGKLGDAKNMRKKFGIYEAYLDTLTQRKRDKKIIDELKRLELQNLELVENAKLTRVKIRYRTFLFAVIVISVFATSGMLFYKNQRLNELNKAKSEFITRMSHEMKTPLNSIIGFTDLFTSITKDVRKLTYTRSIKESSSELLEMVRSLLK